MDHVCVTRVGDVLIVHRDEPSDAEARRRVQVLLMGRLPPRGLVEAWPGDGPDEVRWRRIGR
jgi:hypothetical protein